MHIGRALVHGSRDALFDPVFSLKHNPRKSSAMEVPRTSSVAAGEHTIERHDVLYQKMNMVPRNDVTADARALLQVVGALEGRFGVSTVLATARGVLDRRNPGLADVSGFGGASNATEGQLKGVLDACRKKGLVEDVQVGTPVGDPPIILSDAGKVWHADRNATLLAPLNIDWDDTNEEATKGKIMHEKFRDEKGHPGLTAHEATHKASKEEDQSRFVCNTAMKVVRDAQSELAMRKSQLQVSVIKSRDQALRARRASKTGKFGSSEERTTDPSLRKVATNPEDS